MFFPGPAAERARQAGGAPCADGGPDYPSPTDSGTIRVRERKAGEVPRSVRGTHQRASSDFPAKGRIWGEGPAFAEHSDLGRSGV